MSGSMYIHGQGSSSFPWSRRNREQRPVKCDRVVSDHAQRSSRSVSHLPRNGSLARNDAATPCDRYSTTRHDIVRFEMMTSQLITTATVIITRTVQPVATCRHSPYVHKPAAVTYLRLYIQVCFSMPTTPSQPHPLPSATHWRHRHRHFPELTCGFNSNRLELLGRVPT